MSILHTSPNGTNGLLYALTMTGTFLTEHWYLVVMVVFGFVHVLIAWRRGKREEELHAIKIQALKDKPSP